MSTRKHNWTKIDNKKRNAVYRGPMFLNSEARMKASEDFESIVDRIVEDTYLNVTRNDWMGNSIRQGAKGVTICDEYIATPEGGFEDYRFLKKLLLSMDGSIRDYNALLGKIQDAKLDHREVSLQEENELIDLEYEISCFIMYITRINMIQDCPFGAGVNFYLATLTYQLRTGVFCPVWEDFTVQD